MNPKEQLLDRIAPIQASLERIEAGMDNALVIAIRIDDLLADYRKERTIPLPR